MLKQTMDGISGLADKEIYKGVFYQYQFSTKEQVGDKLYTLASHGLEELFLQLCCCVSFLFRREIGFGLHTTYVLRVPYSCGVVLVFLILAGNSFWCYVHT